MFKTPLTIQNILLISKPNAPSQHKTLAFLSANSCACMLLSWTLTENPINPYRENTLLANDYLTKFIFFKKWTYFFSKFFLNFLFEISMKGGGVNTINLFLFA